MDEEDFRITEDAKYVKSCIHQFWNGKFRVELEMPISKLVAKPKTTNLHSMYSHGSADVVVFCGKDLICVIEPGGSHHFQDEVQQKRDRRKWVIFEKLNNIPCLRIANGVLQKLSKRQRRRLLGKYLFRNFGDVKLPNTL